MYAPCVHGTVNTQGFVWNFSHVRYKSSLIKCRCVRESVCVCVCVRVPV